MPDDPKADPRAHLLRQLHLHHPHRPAEAHDQRLDKKMEAHEMNINLSPEERFEIFGDFDAEGLAVYVSTAIKATGARR